MLAMLQAQSSLTTASFQRVHVIRASRGSFGALSRVLRAQILQKKNSGMATGAVHQAGPLTLADSANTQQALQRI